MMKKGASMADFGIFLPDIQGLDTKIEEKIKKLESTMKSHKKRKDRRWLYFQGKRDGVCWLLREFKLAKERKEKEMEKRKKISIYQNKFYKKNKKEMIKMPFKKNGKVYMDFDEFLNILFPKYKELHWKRLLPPLSEKYKYRENKHFDSKGFKKMIRKLEAFPKL